MKEMVYAKLPAKSAKPKRKFAPAIQTDKHHKILRELPERFDKRMTDVAARNEMLRATEAYNTRIERDRLISHIHDRPASLQKQAAQAHIGDLTRRIHKLAGKGLP